MYSVFEIDYSSDEYEMRIILVCAKSKTDLFKNWKNIRYKKVLSKFDKIENYPGKKVGDAIFYPLSSWIKIKKDNIRKIENMFTNEPYVILSNYEYIE